MKHKVIKKVLMCKPLHFSVEYVINPWMKPGSTSKQKSLQQWQNLVNAYKKMGITVDIIDQTEGLPDMVFATDQGIVTNKKVLLSNFRYPQRQGESEKYQQWFKRNGYTIHYLPTDHYFEGNGESYFWNEYLFVGTGYRTDKQTTKFLEKFFDRKVIPLHIIDPAFYHLDVGFFPLNHETVFYYPQAYTPETRKVLQKLVPNLIEFTKEEAYGFCGNSVTTDHHVILQKNNPSFVNKLHDLGYKTVEVDLEEFKKSGGGAHCLTNILQYE